MRMTVDHDQTRRDAEADRKLAHQAVTEGVNLRYVERMRQALYAAVESRLALLSEVDQADETFKRNLRLGTEQVRAERDEAEARLAKVQAELRGLDRDKDGIACEKR
jgi:Excalibur calcium-binding domain